MNHATRKAMCFSETSADFRLTAWRYIPQDRNLYSRHCEKFKFHIMLHYLFNKNPLYLLKQFVLNYVTMFSSIKNNRNSTVPSHYRYQCRCTVVKLVTLHTDGNYFSLVLRQIFATTTNVENGMCNIN
jgi:hypothetical protein